jgi:hypothetical protein
MSEEKKPNNEIRFGFRTNPKQVISECEKLLKEDKVKELHLCGVGIAIGNVVVVAEIMKSFHPELFQQTLFSTIAPKSVENNKEKKVESKNQKLLPRLEIILSTEKQNEKKEGANPKLSEEERKVLIQTLDSQRGAFYSRRNFRRPFRNNRRRGYPGVMTNQRFAYSAKRTGYFTRRPGYNNRRPYGKNPNNRKANMRQFNGNRNNSASRPGAAKN